MIFHKCNLLSTFTDDVTRYYDRIHYSNRFHTTSYNAYHEAVSVTRLVKAETVSPYYGILINTGMGKNEEILSLYRGDESGAPPHLLVGNRLLPKRHD